MSQVLIIGGGFFGMYLAYHLGNQGHAVKLVEKEAEFMSRASYRNQARVHNGYHYPRSVLTALRSRISFPRFVDEFIDCIDSDFEKYYLIGKPLGKVTGQQFLKFCEYIGAPCEQAPPKIKSLINPSLIEASFSTVEYAFDAIKLKDLMIARLSATSVCTVTETTADKVYHTGKGLIVELVNNKTLERYEEYADHVFNCSYSRINYLNVNSGIDIIPLKHEMTEMCLVSVPDVLKKVGITVMCGPFFSVMPFPSKGLHSFSHVRYTPHFEWSDSKEVLCWDAYEVDRSWIRNSAWRHMQKDAARYLPVLEECKYNDSIWEVKTILPRSETDDSRPILFLPDYKLRGYHCIMGGKIDNIYDAIQAISKNII